MMPGNTLLVPLIFYLRVEKNADDFAVRELLKIRKD